MTPGYNAEYNLLGYGDTYTRGDGVFQTSDGQDIAAANAGTEMGVLLPPVSLGTGKSAVMLSCKPCPSFPPKISRKGISWVGHAHC